MNEMELLAAMVKVYEAANLVLNADLKAEKIVFVDWEAEHDENTRRIERLQKRLEDLDDTTAVTPVISLKRAARLREVVQQLAIQNAGEAAIRGLIGEALTIGEAASSSAANAAGTADDVPAEAGRRGRDMLVPAAMAVTAGAVVMATVILSKRRRRRERGRQRERTR